MPESDIIGKIFFVFTLAMLFMLMIPTASNAASIYEIEFYTSNTTSNHAHGISIETTNPCTIKTSGTATMIKSGLFDISTTFFSPGNVNIGGGLIEDQSNFTCKNIGSASTTNSLNGFYEAQMIVTTSASGNVTITNKHTCTISDNFYNYSITRNNGTDSYENYPLRHIKKYDGTAPGAAKVSAAKLFLTDKYSSCGSELDNSGNVFISKTDTTDHTMIFFYPFNSSGGQVRYDIDFGSFASPSIIGTAAAVDISCVMEFHLLDYTKETDTILHTASDSVGGGTCRIYETDNIAATLNNLKDDSRYAFMLVLGIDASAVAAGSSILREPHSANFSIFTYRGDYLCGEWSACDGTTQTRTCVDQDGIAPDRIEFRTCALGILENATLGFEEFEKQNINRCYPRFDLGCMYFVNQTTTTRDTPLNWTIVENANNRRDFLRMSQDWATEGSRSLKMWYIPPKEGEPIFDSLINDTICTNQTQGTAPSIAQINNNDTLSVNHDVTFPAENMLMTFDVKGCTEQVLHHGEVRMLFDWVTLCPERCYALDCNTTPRSRFSFNLIDTDTAVSVLGSPYYGEADINLARSIEIDISNLGISAGKNYTMSFASLPENLNDQAGNCVHIDNVRYNVLDSPFSDLIPDCVSKCIGDDFFIARLLPTGTCSVVKEEFSPSCTTSSNSDAISNLEDYCIDTTTAAIFNVKIAKYEQIDCDTSCTDGRCITEDEAAAAEAEAEQYTEGIDMNEMITALTSKFAIGAFFLLIVMGLVAGVTKAWQAGAISGLIVLLFDVVIGLWPLEYGLVVGAFVAVLLANEARKGSMGG